MPLFAITIFLGAALLFMVQPMIAKMVLPLLGGSPAVWNTCMVFFQALLLAGYAYAHWSVRGLGLRRQRVLHVLVLAAPLAMWIAGRPPIATPAATPASNPNPVLWLLETLVLCIGPAFLVVSTCGPLMQRWFAATGHRSAKDPYFLYAASNAGSLIALLAYPLLIEPALPVARQRLVWSIGYGLFAVLSVACSFRVRREAGPAADSAPTPTSPSALTRIRWIFLALVPSSLMLAVTQYLSTDIAAIPLLWVVPLTVYLLTFILAFAGQQVFPPALTDRIFPILAVALGVIVLLERHDPIWIIILLNLLGLFFGAMLCHGQLAGSRPHPAHLTEFYLWIALGGVLGGMFNALLAPVLFNSILEYPIILGLACIMRPKPEGQRSAADLIFDIALGMIPMLIAFGASAAAPFLKLRGDAALGLEVGVPLLACYVFVRRPIRFGVGLLALLLGHQLAAGRHVFEKRTFFGAYTIQVRSSEGHNVVELLHGTTLHGAEWQEADRRNQPLIYYHRDGPIGDVFKAYGGTPLCDQVGLVGLGSGALTSYGRSNQTMTIFEIDPAIIEISRDRDFFTYVKNSRARTEFILGDARLSLAAQPEGTFGLIVLDAFSSDAVPVHLLSREAVQMYMTRLKPGGILAFHISNRYLNLESVLSGVTRDLGLAAAIREDLVELKESHTTGHWSSTWVCVARQPADLAPLHPGDKWLPLERTPTDTVWTDDYSSFIRIFRLVKP